MSRTIRTMALVATLLAAAPPMAAAQPQQQGDPMYERRYFDDAAKTEEVGYEYDGCYWYGAGPGELQGRRGPYVQLQIMSYCDEGVLRPVT